MVPSIAEGTILVGTGPSSFSSQNQSSFPIGLIGVNPSTGAQSQVSTGGLFTLPTYTAEAPNQELYVTDLQAFGTGAIIGVDPNTGQQRLLARGGFINGPNCLTFVDGFLYVADEGDASGAIHTIVRIDPITGQQRLVTDGSSGPHFTVPTGMAPAPGNNIYLADEPGNVQGTDPGKVWEINLDTGVQTLVSSNNSTQGSLFNHPVDITLDAAGNLLVGEWPNFLTPGGDHAKQRAILAQRHEQRCSDAPELGNPSCRRIIDLRQIADMNVGHSIQQSPDGMVGAWAKALPRRFNDSLRHAAQCNGAELAAVIQLQKTEGDPAEAMRLLQNRIEDRREVPG